MTPVKILFSGDQAQCCLYIKFALNQLAILERLMSFQKINEGYRPIQLFPNVLIEAWSSFKMHTVKISVSAVSANQDGFVKKIRDEDAEIGVYFFRIKYQDPDVGDYEAWTMNTYLSLNRDRIIVWEPSINGGAIVAGAATLLFDVDVVREEVYYPTGLTPAKEAAFLARARAYISVCPSHAVKEPLGSLKDYAIDWLESGGLSDPVDDSVGCGLAFPAGEVAYTLDSKYLASDGLSEFCPLADAIPMGIDNTSTMSSWTADWCPDPLINYDAGQDWTGMTAASGIVGELTSPYTGVEAHLGYLSVGCDAIWDIYPFDICGYMWVTTGQTVEKSSSYLTSGTWFANKGATAFSCFFVYDFLESSVNANHHHVGEISECTSGTSCIDGWMMGESIGYLYYTTSKVIGGLVTPLETLQADEFLHRPPPASCYEAPCKFSYFKRDFVSYYLGNQSSYFDGIFQSPCLSVEYAGDGYDQTMCSRSVDQYLRRFRNRVHVAQVSNYRSVVVNGEVTRRKANTNLVSLSHYQEIRGVESVTMGGNNGYYTTPLHCDGVAGAKSAKLAEFGYVVYIFSPNRLSWRNPITNEIEYWNIYSERADQGVINPNRCLGIEEYVNDVVVALQSELDNDSTIEKMPSGVDCAYPLNYYGYGITDGFMEKI